MMTEESYLIKKVKENWLKELNQYQGTKDKKYFILIFQINKSKTIKELKKYQNRFNNYLLKKY